MATPSLSVEASARYLMGLGYVLSGPLNSEGSTSAEPQVKQRSLCDGFTGSYSVGLHVGALFLILFVSLLGTAIPILGKCIPWLVKYPFVFSAAKSAATGVLLSVSTIHLIFEGAEAFTEECIPPSLKKYAPLYFLIAMIAVLLMQALDMQLADIAERWMKAKLKAEAEATKAGAKGDEDFRELSAEVKVGVTSGPAQTEGPLSEEPVELRTTGPSPFEREGTNGESCVEPRVPVAATEGGEAALTMPSPEQHDHRGESVSHGHQHLTAAPPSNMGTIRRVISALCMEFGVTLHSVFVGLTVGLTTDGELKPLIVALVFHQLFEGMAMGSRLAEAEFKGNLEIILALVFSFSAPVGMAAAAIAVSVSPSTMSGSGFTTLVAVLDTFCGGILLYLAFTLLLGDFVADVKHYCAEGQKYRTVKKIILFAAVWAGMGLMALVGNWL
ncbi:hypothetical protein GH5_01723 [Leishmania sp. Ghana 2012 LV757]|uniref:Iron/zinc transporter protein-like protein n=2 Tax=Leishmania orientalis TaxID=2249476 RepID=A0A836KFA3_9TRYP|nr:hypothetical protein LSCM4_03421 [Leishmania orientalis]KAG5497181.1 hypothetical protein GH5_01723 [Leishmania sp. Ghana 2012 LV757]